jgi:nucleoside-diphosphate-sugar epimerase
MKILIAGASGFVGKALLKSLSQDNSNEIFALSRSANKSSVGENIHWLSCDLFSLKDIQKVMAGMDIGIYLIHSMVPSAGLVQGDFQDIDLILADNFSRAAKENGLKQIIYLGGIIPSKEVELSEHLKSRIETEETLSAYGTPVTTLRAPIIIGKNGSSFTIVNKLVERLPLMILPSWTGTFSCPVHIDDVVKSISFVIGKEQHFNKIYNLMGPDIISYNQLLEITAKVKGLKRYFFKVPFFTLQLSRLWVSTVTGTPRDLVYPLIQSLKYPMVSNPESAIEIPGYKFKGIEESIKEALGVREIPNEKNLFPVFIRNEVFYHPSVEKKEVRSVQRLNRPAGKSALWVKEKYFEWLPKFFKRVIVVKVEGDVIKFRLFDLIDLLILTYSKERSTPDRQLTYITGGFLAKKDQGRARLEFRETTCGKYFIVAIHEFKPFLPWYIYRFTQAPYHLWVMKKFGDHLKTY